MTINDNFAAFSESLYIAERKARDEVKYRAQVQKKLMQKGKARQEEELRDLASRARLERAGINPDLPPRDGAENTGEQDGGSSHDRPRSADG